MGRIVTRFTRTVPRWRPRITPVSLDDATAEQRAALEITPSNTKVSDYVLVLAHDPETLKVRSPLFNAIMYDPGGLGRADRELGAIGASVVNRCIYCAAVHARRHVSESGDDATVSAILQDGERARLEPRERAILDFAVALSQAPSAATPEHVARLREIGLTDEAIVDLVLSTALFGWANRLMHILGEPVTEASPG